MGEPKDQLIAELLLPSDSCVPTSSNAWSTTCKISITNCTHFTGHRLGAWGWKQPGAVPIWWRLQLLQVGKLTFQRMSWCSWSTSPFRGSHIKSAHFTSYNELLLTVTADYGCLKIKLFFLCFIHYPQTWGLQTPNVIGNSLDNVQGKTEVACCSTAQLDLEQWQQL